MPPSSTSSSSAPALRAGPCARAWLATGVAVACAELALRIALPALLAWQPLSYHGQLLAVEARVLGAGPPPDVLVMGDSRAMVAVMPRVLETDLRRAGRSWRVANVSLSAGTPYDMWKLIERNADALGRVKHLVYFVDAFSWSTIGRVQSVGSAAELFRAEGIDALADLLFRTHAFRAQIKNWAADRWRGIAPRALALDAYGRAVDFAVSERGPAAFPRRAAERRVRRLLGNFAPRPFQVAYFQRIADWCEGSGAELTLFELPRRREYDDALEALHPGVVARYDALLGDLEARGHRVLKLSRRQLALTPEDFHDADHLANSGARKSTRFVAAHLVGKRAASAQ